MFEGEIIFYNGFNLLVDIIIATIAFTVAYRWGKSDGYVDGYKQGESDYEDWINEQVYPEPDYWLEDDHAKHFIDENVKPPF